MDQIKALINLFLVLIPTGAAARILYCLSIRNMDEDESKSYDKRMKNVLVFSVLAETFVGILHWVASYFT